MRPLSFPCFGEDSCSGGKSSSATSCDTPPFALLYKISEPACRLWFFLTGRSTRATSFLFFPSVVQRSPKSQFGCLLSGTAPTICKSQCDSGCRRLLDKIGLDEGAFGGLLAKNRHITH